MSINNSNIIKFYYFDIPIDGLWNLESLDKYYLNVAIPISDYTMPYILISYPDSGLIFKSAFNTYMLIL